LNPINWLAKDQVGLRRRRAQLYAVVGQKVALKQSKLQELDDCRTRLAKLDGDLQRHAEFDVHRRQSDLSTIKQSIASKRVELAAVSERKRRVDEVLTPLVQEIENLESRRRRAESDLTAAQSFERRLSSAGNTYERAMIHEQCERTFGEGK